MRAMNSWIVILSIQFVAYGAVAADGPFQLKFGSSPKEVILDEFKPETDNRKRNACKLREVTNPSKILKVFQNAQPSLNLRNYSARSGEKYNLIDICGIFYKEELIAVFVDFGQIKDIASEVPERISERYGQGVEKVFGSMIYRNWSKEGVSVELALSLFKRPAVFSESDYLEAARNVKSSYLLYVFDASFDKIEKAGEDIIREDLERRRSKLEEIEEKERALRRDKANGF